MANQVTVSNDHSINVTIEPPANVQVQVSRAVIGTVANVASANFANYATNVIGANQPNITNIGTLANLSVTNTATIGNLIVTGNLQVGNLVANSANYANFAGIANTANTVAGANVTGTVANATYAANAGNATIANSANSVAVANVSGIGNIATVNLDGNASNILFGNGIFSAIPVVSNVANANYANFAGTAYSVNGANVSGEVANAAYANAANTANLATYATTANSVAGANVSGTVANATFALDAGNSNLANTANSVAVANVSGIGNIATVNLDGNASNILYGNGAFSAVPVVSNVANANYANFAGTAYSVDGANVSGEVANANFASYANLASTANLATYATTANSVAGANVSGEVANANYASFANVASSANSVAVGNVSGIGNIATINLDGNVSNALLGNGSFGPVEVTSTTIANGTSNINIPVANGNINFSANNNANVGIIDTNGQFFIYPTTSSTNGLRLVSFGNPTSGDVSRIVVSRARGNITTPLSVQNNDTTMRFSTFAHNGTSYQTSSTSTLRAVVDASYTANGANIPIGWQLVVNDTNGGINNQSKTHNFYSNGNVTFAQYVNATGFAGEGGNLSNIQGANVSGTVANATYAANAGNANIANTANSVAVANVSGIGNIATINLDGSSSNVLYGNGVFAPESTNIANANYANFAGTLINGNSNVNITTNANINMNVSGNANVVQIDGNGSIFTNPLAGGYNNWLRINNYGTSANGNSAFASRISSFRFRGNSTAPLSVQPGDGTIDIITLGHNGTSIQSNSLARIRATVDSSYTANGANIPIGWQVVVNGTNGGVNNQQKTHNFYSNGNVAFGGNVTSLNVTGDIGVANVVMSGSAFIGTTLDVVGNTELKNYVTIYPANLTTGLANLTVYNGNVDVANNGAGTGGTVNLVNLRGFANVFGALSSNGYFYCTTIRATSTIGGDVDLRLPTAGAANIQMYAANGAVTTIGTVTAANVQISANGFTKLASYTAAALTAITGQIGWMAAVSNSAGGAHPNGMIAFWDTTNARWSYVHDNSAV